MDQRVQLMTTQLRNQFRQTALETLEIDDPVLHAQFVKRINHQDAEIRDRAKIEQQLAKERATTRSAEPPATMPSR